MTYWELKHITGELEKLGIPTIGDDYLSGPWMKGLASNEVMPPSARLLTGPFPLQNSPLYAYSAESAWAVAAAEMKNGESQGYTVRHAWPLDLFRMLLAIAKGEIKTPEVINEHAKVFVMGSAYEVPAGHHALKYPGPHILCMHTADNKIFLEPIKDPETWAPEPGRKDYILLCAITTYGNAAG